ncbi:MAG: hypothetical protein AAF492_11805 [Verrucomicrobiota bacterium]
MHTITSFSELVDARQRGSWSTIKEHPFFRALISDRLPTDRYAECLWQAFLTHEELEEFLVEVTEQTLNYPHLYQGVWTSASEAMDQITGLGVKLSGQLPRNATHKLFDMIWTISCLHPPALVGVGYALRYTHERLLEAAGGSVPRSRDYWNRLAEDLDAIGLDHIQVDAVTTAIDMTVKAISSLWDELLLGQRACQSVS